MRTKVWHDSLLEWPDTGERLRFLFSWIFSLPHVELICSHGDLCCTSRYRREDDILLSHCTNPMQRPVLPACQEERPELCPTLTHTCWGKKDGRNLAKQRRRLDKQECGLYAQTLVHCELEVICSYTTLLSFVLAFSLAHIRRRTLAHLVFLCCFSGTEWTFCLHEHAAHTRDDNCRLWRRSATCTHCISL